MRFQRFLFAMVPVLVAGTMPAADTAPTLSLEQALASAEKVNANVLLSREAAAQALEQIAQVRAGVLPTVSANVTQRRSVAVSTTGAAVAGTPLSRYDAQLAASYSVLDFSRLSNLKSSRAGYQVAQANYNAVVQSSMTTIASTYFTHLRNLRRLDVLDENIRRAQVLLTLAKNQLDAGVATQIDVTRADSVLSQAVQARLQQETVLVNSELLLKRLLDLDTASPMRLEDFKVKRTTPALYTFSDQKTAFESRADYLAAQKSLEQTKQDVKTATFSRLPTLNVTAAYGEAAQNFDDSDKANGWSTAVALNMPVFDAFRIGADKRVALSRQRAQETRVHNLELQITAEIRLAIQDAASRNAQTTVAEKGLQLAQEELRLATQRYQQGVADNREVVEAQNRLAIAEDNLVDARYQYNLSRLELARAKGDVRNLLQEKEP